jgi:CHAD domain-containing protein
MNRHSHLDALLDKRLRALTRNLPSAREGDVNAVHRTRVASRRVREALPLLDGRLPSAKLDKVRRRTRRITRALGKVRELDVALELLGEIQPTGAAEQLAVDRIHEHLVREREGMRETMLQRLHELKPDKLGRKIADQLQDEAVPDAGRRWQSALSTRVSVRARRLIKAMNHAGLIYLPDRLHAVRVAVKKLRYALELGDESGVAPAAASLKLLKGTQDLLGQLHDVEILMSYTRTVRAEVGAEQIALATALDTVVARLERDCRDLHAQYLAKRQEIQQAAHDSIRETRRRSLAVSPRPSTAAEARPRARRRATSPAIADTGPGRRAGRT